MSERERYWRRVLADCRASGLSRAAYCRQRGISYATLNQWKSRIEAHSAIKGRAGMTPMAQRRRRVRFVEVTLPGAAKDANSAGVAAAGVGAEFMTGSAGYESHAGYEILLVGGRRLRVPRGFDADEVARLMTVVASC
jgi:hypothetical protein